jgi:hypothetical protein
MTDQLPRWFNPPSRLIRQTELFRKWRALMLEHTIQNPPSFLRHLSPIEIRKALDAAGDAPAPLASEPPIFLLQIRAYERQFELIGWSYFIMLGHELNNLQGKLSRGEFEKLLHEIGINAQEAELSMLVAQQEEQTDPLPKKIPTQIRMQPY